MRRNVSGKALAAGESGEYCRFQTDRILVYGRDETVIPQALVNQSVPPTWARPNSHEELSDGFAPGYVSSRNRFSCDASLAAAEPRRSAGRGGGSPGFRSVARRATADAARARQAIRGPLERRCPIGANGLGAQARRQACSPDDRPYRSHESRSACQALFAPVDRRSRLRHDL